MAESVRRFGLRLSPRAGRAGTRRPATSSTARGCVRSTRPGRSLSGADARPGPADRHGAVRRPPPHRLGPRGGPRPGSAGRPGQGERGGYPQPARRPGQRHPRRGADLARIWTTLATGQIKPKNAAADWASPSSRPSIAPRSYTSGSSLSTVWCASSLRDTRDRPALAASPCPEHRADRVLFGPPGRARAGGWADRRRTALRRIPRAPAGRPRTTTEGRPDRRRAGQALRCGRCRSRIGIVLTLHRPYGFGRVHPAEFRSSWLPVVKQAGIW